MNAIVLVNSVQKEYGSKMKVFNITKNNLNEINIPESLIVTVGAFDGIHKGHLGLFNKLISDNYKSGIITFSYHPDYLLNKRLDNGLINNTEEKIEIFTNLGIDYLFILDNEMVELSYQEFNELLKKLNVKKIAIGRDFHYGKNGLGSSATLKDVFETEIISYITHNNEKISSTYLRSLITEGKIKELNSLLLMPFKVKGEVIHGFNIGEKIGVKTANLINIKYQLLRHGVYYCHIELNGNKYRGIANYGVNPTFSRNLDPIFEVHIFNIDEDLYGQIIEVTLVDFMRDEIKFKNELELKNQIEDDMRKALSYEDSNCFSNGKRDE